MREHRITLAGLETIVVEPSERSALNIVMLHGYSMSPSALPPFAHSLGLAANFYFPLGPHAAMDGGWTWWHVDKQKRAESLARGPRDLANTSPDRAAVRQQLLSFIREASQRSGQRTLVGGFSQGGMLSLDLVLIEAVQIQALALFSSCRIDVDRWTLHANKLKDLRTFVSHGVHDPDLSFDAGSRLRDFLVAARAQVQWVPFDGGHEIPLPVWRHFKRFVRELERQDS